MWSFLDFGFFIFVKFVFVSGMIRAKKAMEEIFDSV